MKRCQCGSFATLHYSTKKIRIDETISIVHNVPVYVCDDCGFSFHDRFR